MRHLPTTLQVVGTTLVTIGVGLWSVPVAFVVAGVMVTTFGIAAERGTDARKASQT